MMQIIKYNALNKKNLKQIITILEEENEALVIIETTNHEPIISVSGKSILGDITDEAFKLMGKEYKLIYCQWAVCMYKLDQCKVWGLIPTKYTEERVKNYLYSDPIINVDFKFFYNKDKIKEEDINYNTLEELRHYIIGIIPGYFYEKKIKENFSFIKWYTNTESQLQALFNGNIQIAPIDEVVAWHLINKNYPNDVEKFGVLEIPYTTKKEKSLYIMVCKSYPNAEKILDEFNNALKTLKDTGVIQEIIEKYGAEQYVEVSK